MAVDVTLNSITSGYNLSLINENFTRIDTALQDALSRSGTTPNQMTADLDLNGFDLLNVGSLGTINNETLQNYVDWSKEWAINPEDTLVSTDAGGNGTTDYSSLHWAAKAAGSATEAAASLAAFEDVYLGAYAADPTLDNDGGPLEEGDLYYNTVSSRMKVYNGSSWDFVALISSDFLQVTNDLSDLNNISTARTNLGLGTAAVQDVGLSSGNVPQLDSNSKLDVSLTGIYGDCYLQLDGSDIRLSRKNGKFLTVNNTTVEVPSAGITLAPTGLTPGTLYYVYAYLNSGVLTLEASTTTHTTDSTTNIEIKSGDVTRTLVGMVRPVTGPAFSDSVKQRFVRSWYNRKPVKLLGDFVSVNRTTTSLSLVELNTETRMEYLTWEDELVALASTGWCFQSVSEPLHTAVGVDGTSTRTPSSTCASTAGGPAVTNGSIVHTEGYHYATLLGAITSSGTGTWLATGGARDGAGVNGVIL